MKVINNYYNKINPLLERVGSNPTWERQNEQETVNVVNAPEVPIHRSDHYYVGFDTPE